MTDWISVEDRLPDEGEVVLTYSIGFGIQEDYLTTAKLFTADHPIKGNWPVSHWMPLPAPPEGL